jgi:hypothetical protein
MRTLAGTASMDEVAAKVEGKDRREAGSKGVRTMASVMMERTNVGVTNVPTYTTPPVGTPANVPVGTNFFMVPRCTYKFEKCQGGFKAYFQCEDQVTAQMVQNLCTMLAGGMCGCYVTWNGVNVCNYCFTLGTCQFEKTNNGVCFTCTSGDTNWCNIIQSWYECINCVYNCGCNVCFTINNTPVCCGTNYQPVVSKK